VCVTCVTCVSCVCDMKIFISQKILLFIKTFKVELSSKTDKKMTRDILVDHPPLSRLSGYEGRGAFTQEYVRSFAFHLCHLFLENMSVYIGITPFISGI